MVEDNVFPVLLGFKEGKTIVGRIFLLESEVCMASAYCCSHDNLQAEARRSTYITPEHPFVQSKAPQGNTIVSVTILTSCFTSLSPPYSYA